VIVKARWKVVAGFFFGFIALGLVGVFSAFTASNTVPATRADVDSISITANQLKPWECSGLNLTNIVIVADGETGTSANDLILGTDKNDPEIRGGAGDDCILGGKGNERQRIGPDWYPGLYGEDGNDVLIGGEGNNDYCDGGPGSDTYYTCEVTYGP
jgi:Ca2+-binding RTX toxin-like protein